MGRTTQLKHDVIGDINQGSNTALAAACQAVHHPLRSCSLGIDIANHAARKTTAQIGRANLDGECVAIGYR